MAEEYKYITWFEELNSEDVPLVGGKNANLGEMIGTLKDERIPVPDGYAVTADAYREFLRANNIDDRIKTFLDLMNSRARTLEETGRSLRRLFLNAEFPEALAREITEAYRELCRRYRTTEADVAVRSSATAEDLPSASFAGQQETFLNIRGESELLDACRRCYASLFTNRAISYRESEGCEHTKVALSIGVQKMVRSDLASSGVMFSLDTDTGFRDVVLINAAWGLGENIVQGQITPDEFMVFKPLLEPVPEHPEITFRPIVKKVLGEKEKKMVYAEEEGGATKNIETTRRERRAFAITDDEALQLARWAVTIERHYGRPMDMEWAKDGQTGELMIVQARPETVFSVQKASAMKTYRLLETGNLLLSGLAIGGAISAGKVSLIKSPQEMNKFVPGSVLVTGMTDPDWVPIMKQSAGIITDYGGRTCHAAIVSRELGITAIVGTEEATHVLNDGQAVTLSCAEGEVGRVYSGILKYETQDVDLETLPRPRTRIMMNIAEPTTAMRWWQLPAKGIGLARMEFIINNVIKIHPMALLRYDRLQDRHAFRQIQELTYGYRDKAEYFVDQLSLGIAEIAASQYPEPVIVRMSDFKTNEYADLIGGREFEPDEDNPMLGFRGASRYYSPRYREGFGLECRALKRVREEMGLANVVVMIPFCRTVEEADRVIETMAEFGLKRGENGLEVYVMCEIPSNVVLADQFAERFDGFSIGSNDLTQLVLGVDRDSADLASLFDERNEAVRRMISQLIVTAHRAERKVGICGQAPSDYPEFAAFLVREGIDSISLNPDSIIDIVPVIAATEAELLGMRGAAAG